MRRNPPLADDQVIDPKPRGGECFVFSLATATGKSVEAVRRLMLQKGFDIWNESGFSIGTKNTDIARLIQEIDDRGLITTMGLVLPDRNLMAAFPSMMTKHQVLGSKFLGTARELQTYRGVGNILFRFQHKPRTVKSLVEEARRHNSAMIAMLSSAVRTQKARVRTPEGYYQVVGRTTRGPTHAVAFSPSKGFIDIAVASEASRRAWESRKMRAFAGEDPGLPGKTEIEYFAHGDSVPQPKRPAFAWFFFRGE